MNPSTTIAKELHTWISTIIDSCLHDFHFKSVDNLIELYQKHIGDETLHNDLLLKRSIKWNEIHHIIST